MDPIGKANRDRIARLRELRDGWHDGTGKAPTPRAADAALLLLATTPGIADGCAIFPTDAGGMLLEFVRSGWDLSVEIHPDGMASLSGVETDGPGETDTPVTDPAGEGFAAALAAAVAGMPPPTGRPYPTVD